MRNVSLIIKQFILIGVIHFGAAIMTLILFEAPISYILGIGVVKKSLLMILPSVIVSFTISMIISIVVITFICFILIREQLHHYKLFSDGLETNLTNKKKQEGLHYMRFSIISSIILGLTPLICYFFIIDIRDTFEIRSLGSVKLNIVFINLLFGMMIGMLYTNVTRIIFQPLCRSFQLPLQENIRSAISPLVKMATTSLTASALILLLGHVYFNLNREINSQIISGISTDMLSEGAFANTDQEIRSVYEQIALEYPISTALFWDNISFPRDSIDTHKDIYSWSNSRVLQYTCMILIYFIIISISWLDVYLLSRQFRNRISHIFQRIRNVLKGEEGFAEILALTAYDEIGSFIGDLNLLTMTSQKVSQDVQNEGKELLESLEIQGSSVHKLKNIVKDLEENIIQINKSVTREEEHDIMDTGLGNVRDIIIKVNNLLGNQRRYVDIIANQVNTFASLVDSVKQITEKADREAGILAVSVTHGDEAVQSSIMGMKEIAEASEAIENIVGAITRIAAQTSLLSMNAAIEAAHAGEYGSGFAVLAQEVRSLSESTTAQSRAIREQIESLISQIESGLGISGSTTGILSEISESIEQNKMFVRNITNAMTEQYEGSREIVQQIEASVSRGSRIRNLTDQQIRKSQEIISSMTTLLQISESITALSQESSVSIENISKHVAAIDRGMDRNKEISSTIIADVTMIDNSRKGRALSKISREK